MFPSKDFVSNASLRGGTVVLHRSSKQIPEEDSQKQKFSGSCETDRESPDPKSGASHTKIQLFLGFGACPKKYVTKGKRLA
jgi:hypothetical protein